MPENVSESPETPDPAESAEAVESEAPEVVAHSDESEAYPCGSFCVVHALD
jgi:hypothetical protein